MTVVMPALNSEDLAVISEAIVDIDKIGVDLQGSVMVRLQGRHVGYLILKDGTETMFAQDKPER